MSEPVIGFVGPLVPRIKVKVDPKKLRQIDEWIMKQVKDQGSGSRV